jgi:hypothetical protein
VGFDALLEQRHRLVVGLGAGGAGRVLRHAQVDIELLAGDCLVLGLREDMHRAMDRFANN